ncbi:MAG: hypothetical protein F9K49_06600, partial [Caedimonadaceae bacterium]
KATCYQTQFQLDQELSSEALKKMFKEVEKSLETHDHVIVFGLAYPITIEAISEWLKDNASKFSLEKLSASPSSVESSK